MDKKLVIPVLLAVMTSLVTSSASAIQTINSSQIPVTTLTPLPSDAKSAPKFIELLDSNASSPVYIEGDTQKYVATTGTLHIEALLVNKGNSDVDLVQLLSNIATVYDNANKTLAQVTALPVGSNSFTLQPHQKIQIEFLIGGSAADQDHINDINKIHTIIYHGLSEEPKK